jgi:MATE family multidrug resistance protein
VPDARAAALQTVLSLALLAARNVWGRLFTDDEAVVALTASVLAATFAVVVLDGTMSACWGVLRGCGQQRVMAIAGPIGFYVLGTHGRAPRCVR